MNLLTAFLTQKFVHALGWTILHSLWQGGLVAFVLTGALIVLRRSSSAIRYFASLSAIGLVFLFAVMTFVKLYDVRTVTGENPVAGIEIGNKSEYVSRQVDDQSSAEMTTNFLKRFSYYYSKHLPFIVLIWFCGALFFFLKFLGGLIYTQRLKYYKTFPPSEKLLQQLTSLAEKMQLKRAVTIFESTLVKIPVVIGYFKPVILFPIGMVSGMSTEQVESILAHELAHIVRNDYLVNIFQSIMEILFFYHPAMWWISSYIRTEREHCCDDIAIETGHDSLVYARTLAELEERSHKSPAFVMAINNNRGILFNRIKRIVVHRKKMPTFKEGFIAAFIVMACVLLTSVCSSTLLKKPQDTKLTSTEIDQDQDEKSSIRSHKFIDNINSAQSEQDIKLELQNMVEIFNFNLDILEKIKRKVDNSSYNKIDKAIILDDIINSKADIQSNLKTVKMKLDSLDQVKVQNYSISDKKENIGSEFVSKITEYRRGTDIFVFYTEGTTHNWTSYYIIFDDQDQIQLMFKNDEEVAPESYDVHKKIINKLKETIRDYRKNVQLSRKNQNDQIVNLFDHDKDELEDQRKKIIEQIEIIKDQKSRLVEQNNVLKNYQMQKQLGVTKQIIDELKADGLIKDDSLYTVKISNTGFFVNDEKQSDKLSRKYEYLVQQHFKDSGIEFSDDDFEITFNNISDDSTIDFKSKNLKVTVSEEMKSSELKDMEQELHHLEQDLKIQEKELQKMLAEVYKVKTDDIKKHEYEIQKQVEDIEHQKHELQEMEIQLKLRQSEVDSLERNLEDHKIEIEKKYEKELQELQLKLVEKKEELELKQHELEIKNKVMNALMDELKNDGFLKDKNKKLTFELNKSGLYINGEKQPPQMYEKYKKFTLEHEQQFDDNSEKFEYKININPD